MPSKLLSFIIKERKNEQSERSLRGEGAMISGVYRTPGGFCCDSEKLLTLFSRMNGYRLEDFIARHKVMLRKLVEHIYAEGCSFFEIVEIVLSSQEIMEAIHVISFGKENNIPKEEWLETIERFS